MSAKKEIGRYVMGDMYLSYWENEQHTVGMLLIPLETEKKVVEKNCALEPLVQLHVRGDKRTSFFGGGTTMACSASTKCMKLVSHEKLGDRIVTVLSDGAGRIVRHTVVWHEGLEAVRVFTDFTNDTGAPLTLEMLSSANIGGLTPFFEEDAPGALVIHRARSAWSAEGRISSDTAESLHLEPSWANHGLRVEKIGQKGSMPVRGYFPFGAVEDQKTGVIWAMQLACPSSWQLEFRRMDAGLAMMSGLADFDYGHWAKTLQPGETFRTPEAFLTVGCGSLDAVSQRLLTIQMENFAGKDWLPPVLFNEYCTTWGNPSEENLEKIVDCLRGKAIDYLVIDCGWYGRPGVAWSECNGDWIPNDAEMFPHGLRATVENIRKAGFLPGIWFEPETCGRLSYLAQNDELLLKRDGIVIDMNERRFLDMRLPKTQAYLEERVVSLLRDYGFAYVKIDYNDCIGVGCDGAESLGEGLRQNMEASQAFFRHLREAVPGLCMENCSSGGHRLEPSLMGLFDMASFSDAHECIEIPIIAANLQRMILPAQSQIWAVLHDTDSLRRLNYSLVNTLLGVMCLSGDIYSLNAEQWALVERAIAFYRDARGIILHGVSEFHENRGESWRHPQGWQAVCRTGPDGVLVTIHTFGGELPDSISLPVRASHVREVLCTEGNDLSLFNGTLTVRLKANFEAVAVLLR